VTSAAMRAVLRGLPHLTWRDIVDLGAAQFALVAAQWSVWRRPVGHLIAPPRARGVNSVGHPRAHELQLAMRLARAVTRASRYGVFRPQCLVRALALHQMLERHGVPGSTIRIGVRQTDRAFVAHAWVERDGVVLGDTAANAATFALLTEARMADDRESAT